ncbi:threonine-phosphate decarboxylase [Pelagovum pacificum]|uniref:Aminotransferase n=1 Tax=Pelagovum pacificum TaxID=2588711 RepID=A0A5C5GGI2_9RHOB|nr:threonine-phosphate decarboxylase [Pelagovum pacificum]QQA43189.1 pyridoxal phosphate-dependent class II aminotransferase [Pelagovum pacificum]TNY33670.1 pyridoxal phosphate-dependent class II aminotransferase [Pelagovum pacificum]
MSDVRDHGGGLDAAIARWGGTREGWLDLSTGINPVPYPVEGLTSNDWTALPDSGASDRLTRAARAFWGVPEGADIIAAPGASALIARLPAIAPPGAVHIPGPTYNEHAAAFRAAGREVRDQDAPAPVRVVVHPNNPDGRLHEFGPDDGFTVVDESFCDVTPEATQTARTARPGPIVLKSFGKFWGLAGLRLGFAIGHAETLGPLAELLGPWAVAGPALRIGAQALEDRAWAEATRARLTRDSARLDRLMSGQGAALVGGTTLFRLYDVGDAAAMQERLAEGHVWSRLFPYSKRWLRLGLPAPDRFGQLETALDGTAGGATAQPSASRRT